MFNSYILVYEVDKKRKKKGGISPLYTFIQNLTRSIVFCLYRTFRFFSKVQ